MSVSTLNVFNQFTSAGETVFFFTFYCRSTTWLKVKVNNVVVGSYTGLLNTNQSAVPGGSVTFLAPTTPGDIIRVYRDTPLLQPDVYPPNGPFPPGTVEYDFDRAVCVMQEIAYRLSLIQFPDITPETAGQYLSNDGSVLLWDDPVPRPYVPGFFLAASSPTTLVWAAGGGGGGGPGIMGDLLPDAGPQGAQFTGLSGNVLQLGIADIDDPGVVTIEAQSFSGLKTFRDGVITSPYDVRRFGAVPNDTSVDLAPAFYAAVAAWTRSVNLYPLVTGTTTFGGVYLPQGTYYTSMPLCLPQGCELFGDGAELSSIFVGQAGPNINPTDVHTFSGPVVYVAQPFVPTQLPSPSLPTFASPLVGVTGQSLQIFDSTTGPSNYGTQGFWLHDSFPWGGYFGNQYQATAMSLQFWFQSSSAPSVNLYRGVIGSRGPEVWRDRGVVPADLAYGVYVVSNGTNLFLTAYLTTNSAWTTLFGIPKDGTLHTITSSAIAPNVPIHVELDYDGTHFDFYVDGVNQGHVAATGPIVRAPWEGVAIGAQGSELINLPGLIEAAPGYIDSIRLSYVARHTGTGSFTPPVAKYTWDSSTLALYNWDQGLATVQPVVDGVDTGPLLTLPFLVGQISGGLGSFNFADPGLDGPVKHYIRCNSGHVSADCYLHDFSISGNQCTSGVVTINAWRTNIYRVWTAMTAQWGIRVGSDVSFYSQLEDCLVFQNFGVGYFINGDARRIQGSGCGVGAIVVGNIDNFNNQPTFSAYANVVFYNVGPFPEYGTQITFDTEVWNFERLIANGVFFGAALSLLSVNNNWITTGSSAPPFLFFDTPTASTFLNDQFLPNTGGNPPFFTDAPICSTVAYNYGTPANQILLLNCGVLDLNPIPIPLSNRQSWVTRISPEGNTNVQGSSLSYVPATQKAGTFTIQFGFTAGGPRFLDPMPDANYGVNITPLSFVGTGSPAAGSNRITFPLELRQDGFTANIEVDPGGDITNTYYYEITELFPPPLLFIYLPAIPSSPTNILNGELNTPFAVGVTVVPDGRNTFALNTVQGAQCFASMGVVPDGTNWWELSLPSQGQYFHVALGGSAADVDCFVQNGQLCSLLSPGAHNIILSYTGFNGSLWVDGQEHVLSGSATPPGTQLTPLHIGERFDASNALTVATLRNLKIDRLPARCISNDNDIGPGAQLASAFFGDDMTMGYASTSVNGGACTQIAEARYGTTFYYMAAKGVQAKLLDNTTTFPGMLNTIWKTWQGASTAPQLTDLNVMIGFWDLLQGNSGAGSTAADVYAGLLEVLEGTAAEVYWSPPTSATTPVDLRAFCEYVPPTSGTATCVVNGTSVNCVFSVNAQTTATNLASTINANGTINPLIVANAGIEPNGGWVCFIRSILPGTAGNAYTVTTDGVGNAFIFGNIGGVGGIGLSVTLLNGVDCTATIAGEGFLTNFDTSVNTTIDNLIADIAGNPTTNALVTGVRVGSRMHLTANTNGWAGNDISIGGFSSNLAPGTFLYTDADGGAVLHHFMIEGSNGAIQNGIGNIVLCTVPPFGTQVGYTAGKNTERNALNTLILAYVGAGVTIADVDLTLRNPGAHQNLDPAYDTGIGYLNDAGQTALFGLLDPLLP